MKKKRLFLQYVLSLICLKEIQHYFESFFNFFYLLDRLIVYIYERSICFNQNSDIFNLLILNFSLLSIFDTETIYNNMLLNISDTLQNSIKVNF